MRHKDKNLTQRLTVRDKNNSKILQLEQAELIRFILFGWKLGLIYEV
jgi:hypothetical protein